MPVFIMAQWLPLSVECQTRPPLTIYSVVGVRGLMAREVIIPLVMPEFTAVQVSPLSVERKTPAPSVPAYRMEGVRGSMAREETLSLIHISEPTRLGMISYAVFCLKKKKKK